MYYEEQGESRNRLLKEHMKFELQDVSEPNLFREYFPYSEVPKLPFSDRVVPKELPKDIFITDTTFRDGQQSRPPYTPQEMVDHLRFPAPYERPERRNPADGVLPVFG